MSYSAPDFADDIEHAVETHGAPPSTIGGYCTNELLHLAVRVETALVQRVELIEASRGFLNWFKGFSGAVGFAEIESLELSALKAALAKAGGKP